PQPAAANPRGNDASQIGAMQMPVGSLQVPGSRPQTSPSRSVQAAPMRAGAPASPAGILPPLSQAARTIAAYAQMLRIEDRRLETVGPVKPPEQRPASRSSRWPACFYRLSVHTDRP